LENDQEQRQLLYETVKSLTKQYQGINGTRMLFENCLQPYLLPYKDESSATATTTTKTITAYVTLEPCCHIGKRTPPCTNSLLVSNGISRIVVGSRDPNPQVDGGGIQILQQSHSTDTAPKISIVDIPQSYYSTAGTAPYNCNALITNFAKRITVPSPNYEVTMTGRTKRVLRTFASQKLSNNGKNNSTLPTVSWGSYNAGIRDSNSDGNYATINFSAASIDVDELLRSNTNDDIAFGKNEMIEAAVNQLEILPNWLEHLDGILWQHELVLLRLNKAISKRKGTTMLGNRIAQLLQACVVQSKGHTVLLYRPSSATNPIIDVQNLVNNDDGLDEDDNTDL
jgi:RNA-binding protein YhbY